MRTSLVFALGLAACSHSATHTDGGVSSDDLAHASPDLAGADLAGLDLSEPDLASAGGSTVAGTVLDSTGAPLAGFAVAIGTGTTTTDAAGHFSVSGVATPYDLLVGGAEPAGDANVGATHVSRIVGLTRLDPTVTFATIAPATGTARTVTLSGSIASATAYTASEALTLYVEALDPNGLGFQNAANPQPFSGKAFTWNGAAALGVTFHALAMTGTDQWNYYASKAFTVNDGQTQAVPAIALSAITDATTTATFTSSSTSSGGMATVELVADGEADLLYAFGIAKTYAYSRGEPVIAGSLIARVFSTGPTSPASFGSFVLSRGTAGAALGAVTLGDLSTDVVPAGAPSAVARDASLAVTLGTIGAAHAMTFTDATSHDDWTIVYTGATTTFPDGTGVGIASPGAGVSLTRTFFETEDASVDALGASTAPARATLVGPAQAPFHFGRRSLSSFAFSP